MEDAQLAQIYKEQLFLQYARIGKCLSSERRLEILSLLSNGSKSVETIAHQTGMNLANVSRHLQILLDANLVRFTKKGTYVIYSLANPMVAEFLTSLWKISEHQLSDVPRLKQNIYQHYNNVRTISKKEVLERMKLGNFLILDVRPKDEYETEHIEGAISVPMEELDDYLQNLPKDTEIAAYCRGPYCVFTTQAVEQMQKKGFKAYRIEEGVHEWQTNYS
ncbi:ArsR/SmtB family transcription factor [Paenibacillus sp. OAS669]|uniref:ArsR/SmtB family transcription factor n=1 Tax=Paenibacillus sp. OAS669 TaxID=2663821 RepID=UPI00178A2246|nr:metalloregulator ArsR/SmtB family transcription factor [Paenibacillus sp. OAS669]MBE1442753.1 rhodanese-related sulfurtransferase/predicted transcriptional regulator [Paenibacillus sp. OAS669]